MTRNRWIRTVLAAVAVVSAASGKSPDARAAEPAGPAGVSPAPGDQTQQFDELFIEDKGTGEKKKALLLGGEVGSRTVKGVKASLFFLQAGSPERFRTPGAPTHLLTVSLAEEKGEKGIADASVTLRVTGQGEDQTVTLKPYRGKFYRGSFRMAAAGAYSVEVRFKAGQRSGTAAFPLEVVPPP